MFEITVILICLAINAILSAVEMAIMTVSSAKLRAHAHSGDHTAKRVLEMKSKPERVLSVLQVGITLVGAISAAVGGAGAEENIAPLFQRYFNISEELSESLAIITIVVPLTYFSVVLGELVPKTFALKFPISTAKFGSAPLHIMDKVFGPLVFVLEASTKFICRVVLPKTEPERTSETHSSIEIDNLTETHKQYVLNLLSIDKRKVNDVMIPWIEVVTIDIHADPKTVYETIKASGHTRIPVRNGSNVTGILHAKEFIASDENGRLHWTQLLHPMQAFKEGEPVLNVLRALQLKRSHMALVVRHAEAVGIVTIEDILEEVVGDIYDEDDQPRALMSLTAQLRGQGILGK